MKCPVCGAAHLVRDTRDVGYVYKGQETSIAAITADFCPACDEAVMDAENGDRFAATVAAFQREVNASFVDPAYIAGVRRKLGLDQRAAAEIFGGGINAFSRYETGKTRPPMALVKLLKVLDRHPELLQEVRQP